MPGTINNSVNVFAQSATVVPPIVWEVLVAIYFIYVLIYAGLQIRQMRILQKRLSTTADSTITFFSYGYVFIHFVIFVVALLIL